MPDRPHASLGYQSSFQTLNPPLNSVVGLQQRAAWSPQSALHSAGTAGQRIQVHTTTSIKSRHERRTASRHKSGNPMPASLQELCVDLGSRVPRPKHENPCPMLPNGLEFRSPIADVVVFGHRDPTLSTHQGNPLRVWSVRGKMVVVDFDAHSGGAQPAGDHVTSEVSVQEQDRLRRPCGVRIGSLPRSPLPRAHNLAPIP